MDSVGLNTRFIMNLGIVGFVFLILAHNVFAGLTEAERAELDGLQIQLDKNTKMSETQMQRWEELIVKDPENLKKIRQKEIDRWKDQQRVEGKQIDEDGINRQSETEWKSFLAEKDSKAMVLNEKNTVLFLRQIRDACRIEKQSKGTWPQDLNTLIINNPDKIEADLSVKVKKAYNIQYQKTPENYRVLALPAGAGHTGDKRFLLENDTIFFTSDGSVPTLESNRII